MRKVSIHTHGFSTATQALASRHSSSGSLQSHSIQIQDFPRYQRLLVVHNAAVIVKPHLRLSVSPAMSLHRRPRLRVPRRHQRLHVHVRRDEILFTLPLRSSQVGDLHHWRAVYDSIQSHHREHGGRLGSDDKQASLLRGAKGDPQGIPAANYRLNAHIHHHHPHQLHSSIFVKTSNIAQWSLITVKPRAA